MMQETNNAVLHMVRGSKNTDADGMQNQNSGLHTSLTRAVTVQWLRHQQGIKKQH